MTVIAIEKSDPNCSLRELFCKVRKFIPKQNRGTLNRRQNHVFPHLRIHLPPTLCPRVATPQTATAAHCILNLSPGSWGLVQLYHYIAQGRLIHPSTSFPSTPSLLFIFSCILITKNLKFNTFLAIALLPHMNHICLLDLQGGNLVKE